MKEMKILGIGSEEYEIMDGKARPIQNIAEMKTIDNLIAGNIVKTIGYYTANDGGGALYLIREKTENDVEDRGLIHFINDTLVAELVILNNTVNIKQFGVNSESDTGSVLNTIMLNERIQTVIFEKTAEEYLIITPVNITRQITLDFNHAYVRYEGEGYCFTISTRWREKATIKNLDITGTTENGFIHATIGANTWGVSFNLLNSFVKKFADIFTCENIFNSIVKDTVFMSDGVFKYTAYDMSNANRFENCYFLSYTNEEDKFPDYKFIMNKVKNMVFESCSFEQYNTLFDSTDCFKVNLLNCEIEQQKGAISKNGGVSIDSSTMLIGTTQFNETFGFNYVPLSELKTENFRVESDSPYRLRTTLRAKSNVPYYRSFVSNPNNTNSAPLFQVSGTKWDVKVPFNRETKIANNVNTISQSTSVIFNDQGGESCLITVDIFLKGADGDLKYFESKFIERNNETFTALGCNEVFSSSWSGSTLDGVTLTETLNLYNYKLDLSKTVSRVVVSVKYEFLGDQF